MSELMRANKVTVNVVEEGFKADFYRTHKHLATVMSEDIGFQYDEGVTKSGARELFRAYVISHAEEFGIDWNPADMRAEGNIRKASYETDEDLIDDAMSMLLPQMKGFADACKYPVEWCGISHEDIEPMTTTAKGTDLSALGITDGKYNKSGKWAWALVGFTITLKFNGDEIYMPIKIELVSGQLKKPKMGITLFNETVKAEIIDAGLATEEELDPPKESKLKAEPKAEEPKTEEPKAEEPKTEEPKAKEVPTEDKPKRRRSRKAKAEEE